MGKHVNADAASDEGAALELDEATESADVQYLREHARHAAESGSPLEPQAVISADTHVGVDLSAAPNGAKPAAASPANPDALVEHGMVGDGHELE